MSGLIVRRATADDVRVLAALIDGFAKGHPAEGHVRSVETLKDALFGSHPIAQVLLAERNATAIGFGAWRKAYDLFWSMYGGDGLGLYVVPAQRGSDAELSPLYERVAVGRPERACHISALAFERLAAVAGRSARDIIRTLPEKTLNYVPVNTAETPGRE